MNDAWPVKSPDEVSKWINFNAEDPEWTYSAEETQSMSSLQTEGVAYLWNLLSKHRVALLADEVGMGKTFQALGVAALLWRAKPEARILVMAPNRDICKHWEREFRAFVRIHYRKADGCVKSFENGQPVPRLDSQFRLTELATAIRNDAKSDNPAQLYLTTIHSLSGLVDASCEDRNKLEHAKKVARQVHRTIVESLDGEGFDLAIIDEAHYFRNPNGGSQRSAAAFQFFGDEASRLSRRSLLLTATPSHTRLEDIARILGYFVDSDNDELNSPAHELMQKYALRRFRRMPGKNASYTKHQYRRELASPCKFDDRPRDEMFFALYQRRLIHELGVLDDKRRVLYGYLEGFESAGREDHQASGPIDSEDPAEDERGKDFRAAPDTQLLRKMSADFRNIFSKAPDHPKYGRLVEQCEPHGLFEQIPNRPLHEDKHLVFVRRIPSVRELTKRINERYDEILAQRVRAAHRISDVDFDRWRKQKWSREIFNEVVASGSDPTTDSDESEIGDSEEQDARDTYLGSMVADLFVTKKARDARRTPASTSCSRFSLSLRKSTSIYAMFMEPASNYLAEGYTWYYQYTQDQKQRLDYTKAAQVQRMSGKRIFQIEKDKEAPPDGAKLRKYDKPIETLWSLVFEHLDDAQQATLKRWAKERPDVAENFGNYIKAGFLFASPVIVELYCWFIQSHRGSRHASVQRRYRDFVHYVRKRVRGSLLLCYFSAAVDTFEQLCDKIIDHDVGEWRQGWRTLTTLTSPAWYASGESSHRQHLILGFNSPFYPNVLVATSVFQEGVNLHLQCRKVHHYGIAWTPGDNEQRVGRVDRLFGKVADLLTQHGAETVTLDINYPYLQNTFDEDQVGSFVERKYQVEEKMDLCMQSSFDKEVRLTRAGWHEFLRQPIAQSAVQDPYPAKFHET